MARNRQFRLNRFVSRKIPMVSRLALLAKKSAEARNRAQSRPNRP